VEFTLHIEVCAEHSLTTGSKRHPNSLVCRQSSKPARVQELLTLYIKYALLPAAACAA